jgi:hypothetical protein
MNCNDAGFLGGHSAITVENLLVEKAIERCAYPQGRLWRQSRQSAAERLL